jgi:HSP20 family molecular chaperone IbpA
METTDSKDLKVKEKQEVSSSAEQTRPGLVFTPDVDIFETDRNIILLADMPGVRAENLTIDLRDNLLTLTGGIEPDDMEGVSVLVSEYETGKYYRQFTIAEVVDQSKIDAQLSDGVLRLTLPKVEKAQPRKITVKSA